MPSFFSNKRLIVLLVCMIAVVAVIGTTMKDRPIPTRAEQFMRDSVGFVQSIMYKPARSIAGFVENITEFRVIYTENQRLKANLQEYAIAVAKIRELEEENKSLKSLLDIQSDLTDYQLRTAEVIMRSPDRWYHQLTINRGAMHGIEPNMAVITADGLVGRIKSVAQFTSVVELLIDVNRGHYISAIVQGEERIYGVIENYDLEQEALYFRQIPIDAPIEEGQTVITSGLGGLYPKGLYIGEVQEVIADQYGLTQTALVKPAANMYTIDFAYVVERSFIPEEDLPVIEEEEGSNGGTALSDEEEEDVIPPEEGEE